MRFYTVQGKLVSKSISKYLIDWDKPCRSKFQFQVKQFLRPFWKNHIVVEEMPCWGSLMRADLVNLTLGVSVESMGCQHFAYNKHFHSNSPSNYLSSIKRDFKKLEFFERNNWKVVEINENEIKLLSPEFFKNKFDIIL